MDWWWMAMLIGAVIGPWVVDGHSIATSFRQGTDDGLRSWFSIACITTPIAFVVMWVVRSI